MMKKWLFLGLLLIPFIPMKLEATLGAGATYYVNYDGSNGDGTAGNPYNTIADAAAAQSGGNVFIIMDGTYTAAATVISSVPAGTANQFTMIKASHTWKVYMNAALPLDLTENLRNFEFHGIIFDGDDQKVIAGTNARWFKCIFRDGDSSGNSSTVTIGDGSNVASRMLFEDCGFMGAGGRYKAQNYNSNMLIFRRCWSWHGNGWDDGGTENPAAAFTNYETSTTFYQNCIVINSTNVPDTWAASFYVVDNGPHETNNIHFNGNMIIGAAGIGFRGDANLSCSSWTSKNNVAVDSRDGGMSWGSGSGNVTATVEQFTLLMASLTTTGGFESGFGDFGVGTKNVKNGIVANYTNDDFDGVGGSYFDTFNNGGSQAGTGVQTYNPRLNGLTYLTRIEAGSNLANNGNGGPMGATIEKRWGTSGSLVGQAGYNSVTSADLWPFPNEKAIKGQLCASYKYGFCDPANFSVSLTSYIVGYTARFTSPYPDSVGNFEGEVAEAPAEECSFTTITSSFTVGGVTKSSFTATWTGVGTVNYITVMDDNGDFSSVISTGSISGATSGYINLNEGDTYYFKVKVASEPDCGYTTAISTWFRFNPQTALNAAFSNVSTGSFNVTWTDSTANHNGVLALDSGFTTILTSGTISGGSTFYYMANPETQHWWKVKVSSELFYNDSINTVTLALPKSSPNSHRRGHNIMRGRFK